MLLAVDIGNTRVKWGWHADGRWIARHAARHEDFLAEFVAGAPDPRGPDRVWVCNVAAPVWVEQALNAIAHAWPAAHATRFASSPHAGGLANRYAAPSSLGADRLAAAVGAREHVATGALVVAAFGTATTIDTISPADDYLGGVILPGVALMLEALARNTAQLPHIEPAAGAIEIPDATPDAIGEGVARAQLGALTLTFEVARRRYGAAHLVATGGAARVLQPRLPQPAVLADNLVLDGLQRIDRMGA